MKDLIDATAKELWVAINELDKTFQWQLNWKYHRKVQMLWTMLDDLLKLNDEINWLK